MNIERIKEIQQETAYPESISVQQALLKVWNECESEMVVNNNGLLPDVSDLVCDNNPYLLTGEELERAEAFRKQGRF